MSDYKVVGTNPQGGVIIERNGVRETVPPSYVQANPPSSNSQQSAGPTGPTPQPAGNTSKPPIKDATQLELEKLASSGGGYWVSATGTYYVGPNAEGKEALKKASTEERIKIETGEGHPPIILSPGVTEKVGGVEGFKILMSQRQQQNEGQRIVDIAVQNAMTGQGPDVMYTKEEVAKQQELERNMRTMAMNLGIEHIIPYTLYDPFGFKQLSAMANVRVAGGTKEQAVQAAFEAGPMGYVRTAYENPKAFIFESAMGGLTIASIGVAPVLMSNVYVKTAVSGAYEAYSGYNIYKEATSGEPMRFSETFTNLFGLGLATAGVYTGVREILQARAVDPIIKGMDLKGYHEIETTKTSYVPKYGVEVETSLAIEKVGLGRNEYRIVGMEDIYGKPTDIPPDIRNIDLGVEIKVVYQKGELIRFDTFNFKITPEGLEPLGETNLMRFYPMEKGGVNILDTLIPKVSRFNFDIGTMEKIKIGGQVKTTSIIEATKYLNEEGGFTTPESFPRQIVSMKIIGLERPPSYEPTTIYSSSRVENIIKMTGDSSGIELTKSVFEELGIKDMTGRTPVIEVGAGNQITLTTNEVLIAEAKPIGFREVTKVSRVIYEPTYGRVPGEGFKIVMIPSMGRITASRSLETIKLAQREEIKITGVTTLKTSTEVKTNMEERIAPVNTLRLAQGLVLKQEQAMRQEQITSQASAIASITGTGQATRPIDMGTRPQTPPGNFFMEEPRRRGGIDNSIMLRSNARPSKGLKTGRVTMPTADLLSIEQSLAKTGKATLVTSPKGVREFNRRLEAQGPFMRFPTKELLKRRFKK